MAKRKRKSVLLSACIITDRPTYETCHSIHDLVDEIVIVATTKEAFEEVKEMAYSGRYTWHCNFRVSYMEWTGNFSLVRTASVKRARGKWILYIDSDEWIVWDKNVCPDQLRTYLEECTVDSFRVPFMDWWDKAHTDHGDINGMKRLFKKKCVSFEEVVQNRTVIVGTEEQLFGLTIEHDGYCREVVKGKQEARGQMFEDALKEDPESIHLWYYYAKNRYMAGDIPLTIFAGEKALELLRPSGELGEGTMYIDIFKVVARTKMMMSDFYGADELLTESLCYAPRYSDAYQELAQLHMHLVDHYTSCWRAECRFRKESRTVPVYSLSYAMEEEQDEGTGDSLRQ